MAENEIKTAKAEAIVKKYMLWALGVGLVPIPLIDMVVLVGLQLKMLHSLGNLYEVEFSSQLGKTVIASVVGGGLPTLLSVKVAQVAKGLPLVGWVTGGISLALSGGASTYALGKVFIQHFASGNTLLTFDPQQVREYYAQQFEKGKTEVMRSFAGVKP